MPVPAELGVGLISVGWMGRLHSRAYPRLHTLLPRARPSSRAASSWPPTPTRVAGSTPPEVLGYRETITDYHVVLANPDVDVVSICSPNFLHHQIGLATIAAGKPFWIEKPMGRRAEESSEIAVVRRSRWARHSRRLQLPCTRRRSHTHVASCVTAGSAASPTCSSGCMADYSSDPSGDLHLAVRTRPMAGSVVLGDLLSHGSDLAQFLARADRLGLVADRDVHRRTSAPAREHPPATSAKGDESDPTPGRSRTRTTQRCSRDSTQEPSACSSPAASPSARTPSTLVEVYGTTGSLRWDFERMNQLQLADDSRGYRSMLWRTRPLANSARFQPNAGPGIGFERPQDHRGLPLSAVRGRGPAARPVGGRRVVGCRGRGCRGAQRDVRTVGRRARR